MNKVGYRLLRFKTRFRRAWKWKPFFLVVVVVIQHRNCLSVKASTDKTNLNSWLEKKSTFEKLYRKRQQFFYEIRTIYISRNENKYLIITRRRRRRQQNAEDALSLFLSVVLQRQTRQEEAEERQRRLHIQEFEFRIVFVRLRDQSWLAVEVRQCHLCWHWDTWVHQEVS